MTNSNYTVKDFATDRDVRWCPGCGDYAILKTMQKTLSELDIPKEKHVFVSGIGCSSRFPYYMNTYGFHTIHGRAPAIATGLKLARPDLTVWVITGDGDGLSIGGNHLMHIMRRNVDVNILLFNNRIYGLTKGQYSPTSKVGSNTPTTPYGSPCEPINPLSLALSLDCSFIANAIDVDSKHLKNVILQANAHRGTSFIEIYQNCNVFNDGTFSDFAATETRKTNTLYLTNNNVTDKYEAYKLAEQVSPKPLGVLYKREREIFHNRIKAARTDDFSSESFAKFMRTGVQTWQV